MSMIRRLIATLDLFTGAREQQWNQKGNSSLTENTNTVLLLNSPNLLLQLGCSYKLLQLPLGNYKFREATIQTREKHWKNPDDGLVQTFKSWEMNSDFSVEIALVGLA